MKTSLTIPIGVTAKNEATNILRAIASLKTSIAHAEKLLPVRFELSVILNDNNDNTVELLRSHAVRFVSTTGGLVEAQRAFAREHSRAPFLIFSDADIVVSENAVFEVVQTLLHSNEIEIAYAEKIPLPPISRTWLAKALYLYNLNNGYQSIRHYFNGQFFGIRNWYVPQAAEIHFDGFRNSKFLNLEAGVRCDDIYLSRKVLDEKGPTAIKLVAASLFYRPPETLRGMYRKYQRMRLEIERLNILFPRTAVSHNKWGRRVFVANKLSGRPFGECLGYAWFVLHLYLCKALYHFEKFYYTYFALRDCPTWRPVVETKREIA